jgi:rRNA maturation endonuclease Nob1
MMKDWKTIRCDNCKDKFKVLKSRNASMCPYCGAVI